MMKWPQALTLIFAMIFLPVLARAEYADEIKDQIKETESRFLAGVEPAYFHDMGIIARKADEAELYDLLMDILNQNLFKKMDDSIEQQIKKINDLMERDPYAGARGIADLLRFQSYYEPSAEFLSTASGQAVAGELVRLRKDALDFLDQKSSDPALLKGLEAYHKTSLFLTKRQPENADLQGISHKLDCNVSWARKVRYRHEQNFKTDYEEGLVTEEADLSLQTPAAEYAEAQWRGPWIYHYKGREGEGQGVSEAILKVRRGRYEGDLVITLSKLASTGRFNFPANLSGDRRRVDVQGSLQPVGKLSEESFPLTGCEDNPAKAAAKIENKNGKVLLS